MTIDMLRSASVEASKKLPSTLPLNSEAMFPSVEHASERSSVLDLESTF